jgi:hypothetical protein
MNLVFVPWFLPKFLVKLWVIVFGTGGILSRVGMHSPYVFDEVFGPNGSISSVAIPIREYLQIVEAAEVHTTLGSDGGGVTLTIEKLTGTQAPGGGVNMLKTTTFNLKSTINTPVKVAVSQLGALTSAQAAATQLSPGDRMGLTFTGVLTALAGVGVTVIFKRTRINPAR